MKVRTLALSLFAALAFVGCSEDVTTPGESAPALPPSESMSVDLSFFTENSARLSGEPNQTNFITAATVAGVVNLTMVAIFTPPALAFDAALSTTPEKQDDESWLWTYGWTDTEQHTVEIQLQAWLDLLSNTIDWELRVSDNQSVPPLEDFVWFTGESHTDENSGHWIFYDVDEVPARGGTAGREVVRVEWDLEDESHKTLSIELMDDMDENVGDSLTYAKNATIVSMTYLDASTEETADITYDEITGAGSIMAPDYNNGDRACWDEQQVNVVCPVSE